MQENSFVEHGRPTIDALNADFDAVAAQYQKTTGVGTAVLKSIVPKQVDPRSIVAPNHRLHPNTSPARRDSNANLNDTGARNNPVTIDGVDVDKVEALRQSQELFGRMSHEERMEMKNELLQSLSPKLLHRFSHP